MNPFIRRTISTSFCATSLLFAASGLPATAETGVADTPASPPGDGGIGIFADPAGTLICASIPPGTSATLYLFGYPRGVTAVRGVAGAEFRISVTNPSGYFLSYIAPPQANVVIGNPIDVVPGDNADDAGVNVAFAGGCFTNRFPLGTVQVFNVSGGPTELRVQRRTHPLNSQHFYALFAECTPVSYPLYAVEACAVDEIGSPIAARISLNDPACSEARTCPSDCNPAPCVTLAATATNPVCPGRPVTITATATNCSNTSEQIEVFVDGVSAGTFKDVAPGASVIASRTFASPGCQVPQNDRPSVSALVQNSVCPLPFGAEIGRPLFCADCPPNQAPDCAKAFLSMTELWPPDGRLVSIEAGGATDPDGDPIVYRMNPVVLSDEHTGVLQRGETCPDAFMDGATTFRLRAERDAAGDGRVYRVGFEAQDPSGFACTADRLVFGPRKLGVPVTGTPRWQADVCERGSLRPIAPIIAAVRGGTIEVRFNNGTERDVRVDAYDVRGRLVTTMARGRFAAGEHLLKWDGKDRSGRQAAAGIYVIQLVSGQEVSTTKVVLLR